MMRLKRLHNQIKAVAPIHGISTNPTRMEPAPNCTRHESRYGPIEVAWTNEPQAAWIGAANAIIAAFDDSLTIEERVTPLEAQAILANGTIEAQLTVEEQTRLRAHAATMAQEAFAKLRN